MDIEKSKFLEQFKNLNDNLYEYDGIGVKHKTAYNLLYWFIESTKKNSIIYENKKDEKAADQETYKKYRQHVYWINLGENIGSEFGGYHYAIVIKESKYTSLIVPLTSKKEKTPQWIIEDDAIVDLGLVKGYPNVDKECYACISLIQAVSNKRLDRCGNRRDGYFNVEISNEQMDMIDEMVKNKLCNSVDSRVIL